MLVGVVFFFNDTATTEVYTYGHTLTLHDALPISFVLAPVTAQPAGRAFMAHVFTATAGTASSSGATAPRDLPNRPPLNSESVRQARIDLADRKSTRLNSSH